MFFLAIWQSPTKSTPQILNIIYYVTNQTKSNIKLQGQTNKPWQPTHEQRDKSQWNKLKTTVSYLIVCRLYSSIHVYPNHACHHIPNLRTGISCIEYRLNKGWDSVPLSCISTMFSLYLSLSKEMNPDIQISSLEIFYFSVHEFCKINIRFNFVIFHMIFMNQIFL